jgi:hypothetical protein
MAYHRAQTLYQGPPMKPPFLPFALLMTTALGGCGTIEKDRKAQAMEEAMTTYGEAIRWGYFDTAYGYVPPDKHKGVPKYLENVRVTSYEVLRPPLVKSENTAQQIVRIDYVHKDTQRLRSLSDHQLWSYDKQAKAWWLQSRVPQFGYRKR